MMTMCLASCAPIGHAVGDTQDTQIEVAHDYIDRSDYSVALVGSHDDDNLVQTFRTNVENNGVSVYYAEADNGDQQRKAVEDFCKRKITFIVVHPDDPENSAWKDSLGVARQVGTPVIFLDGSIDPDDQLLYAANFIPTRDMEDIPNNVYSVYHALAAVINADSHEKEMYVHLSGL